MRWLFEVPTMAVVGGGWTDNQELDERSPELSVREALR